MFYDLEREPGQPFSTESYLKFYIYLQLMILVFNCEYIFPHCKCPQNVKLFF